jgi:hypothetical protein
LAREYVPSLHWAVASAASLFTLVVADAFAGVFAVLTVASGLGVATVVVAAFTPPCPEHAPRPDLLLEPSAHATVLAGFFAAAVALASTPP